MNITLTAGHLFAGIDGFGLGFTRAGIQSVWQVEIDDFATRILEARSPDVRRYRDVRSVGYAVDFPHAAPRAVLASADVITAGFPCQEVSLGNNRGALGLEGPRSGLWSEVRRILEEGTSRDVGPRYVVLENSPALRLRGFDVVLSDLASLRYDAIWDCLPISAYGAHHTRDRIIVVAWPASNSNGQKLRFRTERRQWPGWRVRAAVGAHPEPLEHGQVDGWDARPAFCRMGDGLPKRLDQRRNADNERQRVVGNSFSPIIAEDIAQMILEAEIST